MPRAGFEPAAYPLGGDRSIQLSYRGRSRIVAQMTKVCGNWHGVRATRAEWPGTIPCMKTAELVDMSAARSSVLHMSKMIQIRNVPDELHRELKMRAAAAGMSLSDYIKKELSYATERDSWEEIHARVKARGPLGLSTQEVVDLIREGRGD